MVSIGFGFYPYRFDRKLSGFEIVSLEDIDVKIAAVMSDPGVHERWIYAPPREHYSIGADVTTTLPFPSRVFGLPNTHLMKHSSGDMERIRFLVWALGFFVGIRLSTEERSFLDASALEQGACNDLVWPQDDLCVALEKTDLFYKSNVSSPQALLALRAVMHSLFLAATPTLLDFERFIHLYTALDAAFAAHNLLRGRPKKKQLHGERAAYLCEMLGLSTPWWADRNSPYVADRRNETIHEGLFFGEPWGYMTFGGTERHVAKYNAVLLQLRKLLCRIMMALLNIRDEEYLKSAIDNRQRHRIRLGARPAGSTVNLRLVRQSNS